MATQSHFQIYLSILAAFSLFSGVLGLLWSTLGSSGLNFLLGSDTPVSPSLSKPDSGERVRLEVIVAAFNEEKVIRRTVESLLAAAAALKSAHGDVFDLQITVGLDHCTDLTRSLVDELALNSEFSIIGVENPGERGKWNTLLLLIGRTAADWVALVDSGSIWEPGLLVAAWPAILNRAVIGVAPSYSPQKSGLLETANWRLERFLKESENRVGGPVSVHGATVLYRRIPLLGALATLHGRVWLNDDVVVPLVLRLQNPASRIVYLAEGIRGGWVTDVGVASELGVEYRRRRRMVVGNLQWIRHLLLPQLSIVLVASRRVFRVFWAYWILLIFVGLGAEIALALRNVSGSAEIARALVLELSLLMSWVCATGAFLFSNWVRRFGVAFVNGLLISRYWKELSSERGVSWV